MYIWEIDSQSLLRWIVLCPDWTLCPSWLIGYCTLWIVYYFLILSWNLIGPGTLLYIRISGILTKKCSFLGLAPRIWFSWYEVNPEIFLKALQVCPLRNSGGSGRSPGRSTIEIKTWSSSPLKWEGGRAGYMRLFFSEGTVWASTEVQGVRFRMEYWGQGWKAVSTGQGSDHNGVVSHGF